MDTEVTEQPFLRVKVWWPERIAMLTEDWARGLSCEQISRKLGDPHVSRNAVIGKIFRLKLPSRKTDERKPYVAPNRPRRRSPNNVERSLVSRAASKDKVRLPVNLSLGEFNALIPLEQRRTLFELTHWTCRFPVGEGAGMFFCGALPANGYPYCTPHCGFAH